MERLTMRIDGYAYGKSGIKRLSKDYHRGSFECTALIERLADYEDLEEKGLLVRLPCQLGRTLYVFDVLTGLVEARLKEYSRVPYFDDNMIFEINGENVAFPLTDIGKSVFFTRREADKKLKEMQKEGA